jgi:thiol-disulfide isomerase/thioredoxin
MKSFLLLVGSLSLAYAQETEKPFETSRPESPQPTPLVQATPREMVLDTLFSIPATKQEMDIAIDNAKKQGVHEQTILEARFLYFVEHSDDAGIVGLLPELEKQLPTFTLDDSEIFATAEDFQAIIEFAYALKAISENKNDDFKKHITEALWLSPSQASAFTPYIEKTRLREHVKKTVIALDTSLNDLHTNQGHTLQSLLGKNHALLLLFWSPWSPDCETTMTDVSGLAKTLPQQKISLSSILVDGKSEIVAEAKEFLKGQETPMPGTQLVDRSKNSLGAQLRITNMPTLVLLTPEGKILFHGPPEDPVLEEQIKLLSASPSPKP